jgi:hypothetical protein
MAYALFAGENYYPAGGIDDFIGLFDTIDAAKNQFIMGYDLFGEGELVQADWGQIVDTATFRKVLVWTVVTPGKRATKTRPAQLDIWGWVAP